MDFGWKALIPIALGWFMLLAALREFAADGSAADSVRVTASAVAVGIVATALFSLALRVSRNNRERLADSRGATS
jgi:NADH-quinone oxidoreductase subunit H